MALGPPVLSSLVQKEDGFWNVFRWTADSGCWLRAALNDSLIRQLINFFCHGPFLTLLPEFVKRV